MLRSSADVKWYHTTRILLHSRYIRRSPSHSPIDPVGMSMSARQTCSEAAQATMDILSRLDKHHLLTVASSDMLHILSLTTLFEGGYSIQT